MSVIAIMTIYGHNVTMRKIRIADLKARLSEHLRLVRGGETIAVLDRETPIAHIVPIRARHALRVRKPSQGAPAIHKVALPGPAGLELDIVRLLLEERQGDR
jgi:antitoxin (DNA-binding transcriptional repressor) of toxin-antitoxin stability system